MLAERQSEDGILKVEGEAAAPVLGASSRRSRHLPACPSSSRA
ncbi:MAG: hypothetical protein R3D25_22305 [Geminicoccaceae bacterium]